MECSTAQSPLQLQALCEVWLRSLGEETRQAVRWRKPAARQNFRGGGGLEEAEAEGLGQNAGTETTAQAADRGEGPALGEEGLDGTE